MSGVLLTRRIEKPWGRDALPAPFVAPVGQRIGEIWFEPPPELSELLVKYIFTSEKLSVQVHPSDAQLPERGKDECWLIVDADPGAVLGIGFRQTLGPEAIRQAALDGSIDLLMEWHTVRAGDFFYIPAGTVHAIGAGVSLIEVQQNSDVTYRLHDYGRPRELHLDQAVAVAHGEPYPMALHQTVPSRGSVTLVDGPLFRLDRIDGKPDRALRERYRGAVLLIPREGSVEIAGKPLSVGSCGYAESLEEVEFAETGLTLMAQLCSA